MRLPKDMRQQFSFLFEQVQASLLRKSPAACQFGMLRSLDLIASDSHTDLAKMIPSLAEPAANLTSGFPEPTSAADGVFSQNLMDAASYAPLPANSPSRVPANLSPFPPDPTPNPPPPKLSSFLYIPHFNLDFAAIAAYCLDPATFDLDSKNTQVRPLSCELISLMHRYRLKELRKEQKIKKIMNLVFKKMLTHYTAEHYPCAVHVTDAIKKSFCTHYFSSIPESPLLVKPDYRSRKMKREAQPLTLTYNAKFFDYVQKCTQFLGEIEGVLRELETEAEAIVKADVLRLLKRIELSFTGLTTETELTETLREFFTKKNAFG